MSEATAAAAFAKALASFQASMPRVEKSQTAKVETKGGGSYSYTFADLADLTLVVFPALATCGLSFTAAPEVTEQGFVLRCALLHSEGHRETGSFPLPDPATHSPQQIGSAITYARRYALTALTGVAPSGEDDDAQKAQDARARAPRQPQEAAADPLVEAKRHVWTVAQANGITDKPTLSEKYAEWSGGEFLVDATERQLTDFARYLNGEQVVHA